MKRNMDNLKIIVSEIPLIVGLICLYMVAISENDDNQDYRY